MVANNSFEQQQDKFDETQGIEIEQTLRDSAHHKRKGKSTDNARNNHGLSSSQQSSFLSVAEDFNILNNQPRPLGKLPTLYSLLIGTILDPAKVNKLVSFGYPKEYIKTKMREMEPNFCTAGYYLLEMDQNYCWQACSLQHVLPVKVIINCVYSSHP